MSDADPKTRWSPPVATASVFSDEQKQRIHALRAAREIVEFKTAGGPMSIAGTDFKESLLLVLAMWIVDGKVTTAAEFEADLDRWIHGQKSGPDD